MEIVRGENALITLPIVDVNGDPLVISSLERFSIQLQQFGRIKGDYQLLPTPDLVQTSIKIHASVNTSVTLEISQAVSARLKEGELFAKIFMGNSDAEFTVDEEELDIDVIKIADVI